MADTKEQLDFTASPETEIASSPSKSRPRLTINTPGTPVVGVLPLGRENGSMVPTPSNAETGTQEVTVPSLDGLGLSDVPGLPAKQGSPEPTKRSILIVDDNPINIKVCPSPPGCMFPNANIWTHPLQSLTAYMIKLKHSYVSAMNGLEAMKMYNGNPEKFRCIVTDISMPVMDGLECTRRIREFERAQKLQPVTVIALTGLSGKEIQHDAFVSGVDLFLTRPIVFKGLEKALEVTGHGAKSCAGNCTTT